MNQRRSTCRVGLNHLQMTLVAAAIVSITAWVHDAGGAEAGRNVEDPIAGWLHWRGPDQNGTSREKDLPDQWVPGDVNHLWSFDLQGRGTPVIAQHADGARVYTWGYRGEGRNLVEVLACLDARTGNTIWEKTFADFISDIIYNRYSIGSPTVDPETGNLYLMTSPGLLVGFDPSGRELWQRSMMEQYGRLTFPNGRTGAPAIEGDLVIVNAISTNWGREGPARNRFYAFDKHRGELIWSSTPGVGPPFLKDSSFCSPVFASRGGRRVFFAGTGCGNIVCVNAVSGEPFWRFQLAIGGVNSSVVLHGDHVIALHGKENPDDSGRGRMVAIDAAAALKAHDAARAAGGKPGPTKLDESYEVWRNDALSMFTSSPVIVGNRVYQVTIKGELYCVDAASGKTLWHLKLGADQLHASPLYADGKLYVPMWHDGLYIVKPTATEGKVLDHIKLEGACLGSPSVWNGRVFVHTTKKLYCFGKPNTKRNLASPATAPPPQAAEPTRVQPVPAEVLMRPGQAQSFAYRFLDAAGRLRGRSDAGGHTAQWKKFVPAKAKVKAKLDADFDDRGLLVAAPEARRSAGAFQVTLADSSAGAPLKGTVRGRILPTPPYTEDFESFDLKAKRADGTAFAYPPLPWIGARLKWEIRDVEGNKALVKTLDRWLFQRSTVFMGHPDDRDYTISADVMSHGNRRTMSDVGLVNQRYIIVLRGNGQRLEVNSNIERLAESVPITWHPGQWYRLETRVDIAEDGSGVVRGKAWPKSEDEPDAWTIEVPVKHAHRNGAPGLFGFSPNIKFSVIVDNVSVVPNSSSP